MQTHPSTPHGFLAVVSGLRRQAFQRRRRTLDQARQAATRPRARLVAAALVLGLSACSVQSSPLPTTPATSSPRVHHTTRSGNGVATLEADASSSTDFDAADFSDAGVVDAGRRVQVVDGGAALPSSTPDAGELPDASSSSDAAVLVDGGRCFYRCAGLCQLWPCP